MPNRSLRTLAVLGAAACVAAVVPAASAAAGTIGPGQYFVGVVTSHAGTAVIDVFCPGPVTTGHPLPNQTLGVNQVLPPITSTLGYTGLTANSINAWLSWPSPVVPPPELVATFTSYGTAAIPTTITVPCGGTGTMTFVPNPDDGGRASTVQVTFRNLGA
jgi:hypothetical protein